MDREELSDRLRGGLFLSAMMGCTDGAFVAWRGVGAAMVQIGAYVADAEDRSHDARCLLPLEQEQMVPVLRAEVEAARGGLGDTPIALNGAAGDLDSALCMAGAFLDAGGDLFELNVHGGYEKLLRRGLLRAMALPQNRPALLEWLGALCGLRIPVIVKFMAATDGADFEELLGEIAGIEGLLGVHFNVRMPGQKTPDLDFVRGVRPLVKGLLLCSGHVGGPQDVDALMEAGADCVGIAQAVLGEPDIIARLGAETA